MKQAIKNLYQRLLELSSIQKFFAINFLFCTIFSLLIFYFNYLDLKHDYDKRSKENITIFENKIHQSLNSYNEILSIISKRLVISTINYDSDKISALLKQFYLNSNQYQINFLDIRWQSTKGNYMINRYGIVEEILDLPKDIQAKLQTVPGSMFVVASIKNILNLNNNNQIYCLNDVINNRKKYIGFLAILPNFED